MYTLTDFSTWLEIIFFTFFLFFVINSPLKFLRILFSKNKLEFKLFFNRKYYKKREYVFLIVLLFLNILGQGKSEISPCECVDSIEYVGSDDDKRDYCIKQYLSTDKEDKSISDIELISIKCEEFKIKEEEERIKEEEKLKEERIKEEEKLKKESRSDYCYCEEKSSDAIKYRALGSDYGSFNRSAIKFCAKKIIDKMDFDMDWDNMSIDFMQQFSYEMCEYGYYKEPAAKKAPEFYN